MTIDEIVSVLRALPLPERLRVIEIVALEAAREVPCVAEPASGGSVALIERHGFLLVDTDATVPADAFDHRLDREVRAGRHWVPPDVAL
jgi:hypothetical protein